MVPEKPDHLVASSRTARFTERAPSEPVTTAMKGRPGSQPSAARRGLSCGGAPVQVGEGGAHGDAGDDGMAQGDPGHGDAAR